ncbi:hypothetical protein RchiOBHm_Chr1g0318801 [Rosa chinensis]|uniref:DUF247 domain protein n=1 Tax=Rosa chinensis TaxID=74649 RepID=A0A2P6S8C5_ROSCH|nr:UPF0481 protein At3g47200 [Rosa chinensis]XP_040368423.1 UPF0481 protein At3g47200 [Rosa chinensis]PRQ54905.1 hypothetical protein RchiOBHm_Chr1g0318801 [Rosa chinensis]
MAANHRSGTDHTVIDIIDDREKSKKCIFRVPKVLRRRNPEAYTPDSFSIGPYHHYREKRGEEEGKGGKEGKGEEDFQRMGGAKKSYLDEILARMKNITLEELTAKVIGRSGQRNENEFEERARSFYDERFDISPKDFIKMMIVDGCFLVQLFRKCNHPDRMALDDPVFTTDSSFHFLCHDILLLENQLPWFVIRSLYSLTLEIYPDETSLPVLILNAFSILAPLKQSCSSYFKHLRRNKCHCDADYLHILDLVRDSIIIPIKTIDERAQKAAGRKAKHHQMHAWRKDSRGYKAAPEALFDPKQHQMPTATALSNVGIKFQSSTKRSIMDIRWAPRQNLRKSITDIRFKVRWPFRNEEVLKIPQLDVDNLFECLFRNLIYFEHCCHGYSSEITSFSIFMDKLISSKDDLELLCKEKVIIGSWESNEEGRKFFRSLYKDIPQKNSVKFYYADLCGELNNRYKTLKNHRLGESTRQQLIWFSNPWNAFYVIVGIFLLQIVPTILQTTYTIKQYYSPSP